MSANCVVPGSDFYPRPPLKFVNNTKLLVSFKTERRVLEEHTPKPLEPNPENLVLLYVGDYNLVSPRELSWTETGILIPADLLGSRGLYCAYIYCNHIDPIVGGRETWGYPKKDAEISFTKQGDNIEAKVVRYGTTLIDASFHSSGQATPIPPPEYTLFMLKSIPSVDRSGQPELLQLISDAPTFDGKMNRCLGKVSLELASGPQDPLGRFAIKEVDEASFTIGGTQILGGGPDGKAGQIVYDYLSRGTDPF